jgi:hypothetical protein
MPPKAVLTHNFFTPLRTINMDMETSEAKNTLQEIPGRLPVIVMTFTTNLIQLQSNLKGHIKGEYKFQNS